MIVSGQNQELTKNRWCVLQRRDYGKGIEIL